MNPENTLLIRGRRSDGPEAAFIKVVAFVGLYFYNLCTFFVKIKSKLVGLEFCSA